MMAMKRAASLENKQKLKKRRTDPLVETITDKRFDPSLEKQALEYLPNGGSDEDGFIRAKVHMKWPVTAGLLRLILEPLQGGLQARFEVKLIGTCLNYTSLLQFEIGDIICLKLTGANGDASSKIPVLLYEAGVIFLWVKTRVRENRGKVVDTFGLQPKPVKNVLTQDDWFATPAERSVNTTNETLIERRSRPTTHMPSAKDATVSHPIQPTTDLLMSLSTALAHDPASGDISILPKDIAASMSHASTSKPVPTYEGQPSKPVEKVGLPPPKATAIAPRTSTSSVAKVSMAGEASSSKARKQHPSVPTIQTARSLIPTPTSNRNVVPTERSDLPQTKPALSTEFISALALNNGNAQSGTARTKKLEKANARRLKREARRATATAQSATDVPIITSPSIDVRDSLESPLDQADGIANSTRPSSADIDSRSGSGSESAAVVAILQEDDIHISPIRESVVIVPFVEENASTVVKHVISAAPPVVENPPESLTTTNNYMNLEGHQIYTPLGEVKQWEFYNIMGVVTWTREISTTSTNEFKMGITIADTTRDNFTVNIFSKSKEQLPVANKDEIVLFRDVQADPFGARAPSYKQWTWAVFDPVTGKIRSNNGNSSDPASRTFQPDETEMQCCIRLEDWWRSRYSEAGTVQHVVARNSPRKHMLIREAKPDMDSGGYFDCTVEVLNGFLNDNGVYSLYVTDYTRHPDITPVQSNWCPPLLGNLVLKIEMWDEAAKMGPDMKPGEYYHLRNARMMFSNGIYLHGKLVESKIQKLDEEDLDGEPALTQLLCRKKSWQSNCSSHEFPHRLFKDVKDDELFLCTVEVLNISHKDGDRCYLYVTDYTPRSDLAPVSALSNWARGLKDIVVKIVLNDGQVEIAQNLEPGDVITIQNLRFRPVGGKKDRTGWLGGHQRLIHKLQTHGTISGDVQALLQRKSQWEAQSKHNKNKRPSPIPTTHLFEMNNIPPPELADSEKISKRKASNVKKISEIKASARCPNKFRTVARIIDFYPIELADCVVLRCTQCGKIIPDTMRICAQCDNAMDDVRHVRPFYCFFFRVEDEEHEQLTVEVSEMSSLMSGLPPKDLREDLEALEEFREQLKPVLGNVLQERERLIKGGVIDEQFAPDSPMLSLSIGSWSLPDGERAYVLLEHAFGH